MALLKCCTAISHLTTGSIFGKLLWVWKLFESRIWGFSEFNDTNKSNAKNHSYNVLTSEKITTLHTRPMMECLFREFQRFSRTDNTCDNDWFLCRSAQRHQRVQRLRYGSNAALYPHVANVHCCQLHFPLSATNPFPPDVVVAAIALDRHNTVMENGEIETPTPGKTIQTIPLKSYKRGNCTARDDWGKTFRLTTCATCGYNIACIPSAITIGFPIP